MPGIAGIIGAGFHGETRAAIGLMVKCMMHESFYRSGTQVNERLRLWTGWVCHENSFSDCMPVWNERRDICLIFIGENYADRPELDRLRATGHEFETENAGCLVHLYEEFGIKFLEKLNGWFSGVLVDLRKQEVVLFNDRFGLGRIYYHENEHGLFFSSEAKSLLKVLPAVRQLDLQSLGEFFSCGCVLQNRTLFSGISLMPGGSVWTFSPGQRVRKETYFKKERWEQQPLLNDSEYYEKLKETWARVLPRYFRGKQRAALSLTGGVDSRMILAWSQRPAGKLPCYTFGGMYRDCADVKISREVARICRQQHEVIPVDGEFLSEFPALAEKTVYVSDGTMDVTGSIDLYIQQAAQNIAPVRITGTYGGEILRSLLAFKPMPVCEDLFDQEFLPHFRAAAETYTEEIRGNRLSFTAFKQAPWYMASKFVVERSEVTLRMPYFDNDLVSLVYRAPAILSETNGLSLRLIADGNPALAKIGTDRGVALSAIPGLTQARHLFQEFTFKAEYAYDYGMPQWLAGIDHVFAPLRLERFFLGRHKFHHFRVFYRDELSDYLRDMLLNSRAHSRSYLNGDALEKMVNGHIKGNRNYTLELHKVLTTELIHRQFIGHN